MKVSLIPLVLAISACAPAMMFNADDGVTHAQRVASASRLATVRPGCETLGTLTFDGHVVRDSDIDAVAEKVASVGGTHYVVRNRTAMRHGKLAPSESVAVVLVCPTRTARR